MYSQNSFILLQQRMEHKNRFDGKSSALNDGRLARLQSIGFRWAKRKGQASWEEKFVSLCVAIVHNIPYESHSLTNFLLLLLNLHRRNSRSTRPNMATATCLPSTKRTLHLGDGCPHNVLNIRNFVKEIPRVL